jgi:uncharacterized membrane protein YhaH (DUF805 family)
MMNYMLMPLRRYADFDGRSRRKEFWLWQLLNLIVSTILFGGFIAAAFSAVYRVNERGGVDWNQSASRSESSFTDSEFSYGINSSYEGDVDPFMFMEEMGTMGWILFALGMLWALFVFIPNLAVIIRRLHDQDKSGWFILMGLIPVVGPIILLVFYCIEGTRGPNRFGPDPKGADVGQTFA